MILCCKAIFNQPETKAIISDPNKPIIQNKQGRFKSGGKVGVLYKTKISVKNLPIFLCGLSPNLSSPNYVMQVFTHKTSLLTHS